MLNKKFIILLVMLITGCVSIEKQIEESVSIYYDSMWQNRRFFITTDQFKNDASFKIKTKNIDDWNQLLTKLNINEEGASIIHDLPNKNNFNLLIEYESGEKAFFATNGHLYKKIKTGWLKFTLNEQSNDILHCKVIKYCFENNCILSEVDTPRLMREVDEYDKYCQ